MPAEFTEIGSQTHLQGVAGSAMVMIKEFAASVESTMTVCISAKMQCAITGVVINTRSGGWMVSHSFVNAAQPTRSGAATASDQTVSVYSFNVMILIAFTSHATDTWPGV
eukprot:499008-Amphidinium_carterae.5